VTLLIDFLCRFGWGLSAALVLTPPGLVPSGFFRVNLLVVLGLATFAALLARTAVPGSLWLLAVAAGVSAWLGSIVWLAGRPRAGMLFCVASAAAFAAAAVLLPSASTAAGAAAVPRLAGVRLLSGLVVGLTVHAMLLGHWYLNAPGMRVDALRRMIDLALLAWGVQLAVAAISIAAQVEPVRMGEGPTGPALVALRWMAGLAGLPVLLWLSRKTLDIPNTQSATGILYVACIAAIVGELTAQLLQAAA
jgi:hypothetical protein